MSHRRAVVAWVVLAACGGAPPTARPSAKPQPPPSRETTFFTAPDTLNLTADVSTGGTDVPKMRVHLIDVGQGAATLIEFSCAAVLVDTGGESNDQFNSTDHLVKYLDGFFASRPDLHETIALLLITHPHIDHARGAKAVWERYHVKNVVTDGKTNSSGGKQQEALITAAQEAGIGLEAIEARAVPAGGLTDAVIDPVNCDDADPDIRVLWGAVEKADVDWTEKVFDNANNHSVVTKITLGKSSIVITGDLEVEGIAELLKHNHDALDADVYEVGHHGSYNGTTKELLDAVTPKLALIGMGPSSRETTWTAWAYGHPRAVTIELLERALSSGKPRAAITEPIATGAKQFEDHEITAPIFATGWDGDVRVTLRADGSMGVATRNSQSDHAR